MIETQELRLPRPQIGGWLLFYCIYTGLADVMFFFTTRSMPFGIDQAWGYVQVAVELISIVSIVTRKPQSLRLVALTLGISLMHLAFGAGRFMFFPATVPQVSARHPILFWAACLSVLAWIASWFFYFKTSKRVLYTLGANL